MDKEWESLHLYQIHSVETVSGETPGSNEKKRVAAFRVMLGDQKGAINFLKSRCGFRVWKGQPFRNTS